MIATFASLFLAAFLAATLFPAQSEAFLAYLIISNDYPVSLLVLVATFGNVLGSVLNYAIGLGFGRWKGLSWMRPNERAIEQSKHFYRRFGRYSLFLSWMPVIGDPITLIAGVMKERFMLFLAIVSIAKLARYFVVALFAGQYV